MSAAAAYHDAALDVRVGLPRQALDLDVHEDAGTRLERLGERRDLGVRAAQLGEGLVDHEAVVLDLRIVVHDEHPVRGAADVELDPVGAEFLGEHKRGDGVLGRLVRRAAVCEDERSV